MELSNSSVIELLSEVHNSVSENKLFVVSQNDRCGVFAGKPTQNFYCRHLIINTHFKQPMLAAYIGIHVMIHVCVVLAVLHLASLGKLLDYISR